MKEVASKTARPTNLVVDLKTLKAPWQALCQQRGQTPSEAIRRLVQDAVDAAGIGDGTQNVPRLDGAAADLRRHELRMTDAEALALAEAARKEGMSSSRYLVAMLRAQLMDMPPFRPEEIEALAQSNRLLMGLLNAMTKAARDPSTPVEQRRINQAQIKFIKDLVDSHVRAVSAVLTANSRRWRR